MRTELEVVNACLATMGLRPLNSLSDPHPWKGAAQDKLAFANSLIQGRGHWFNKEELTITPNVVDSYIYLPADTLSILTASRRWVQRSDKLYNLEGGTYVFTEDVDLIAIREVPFEDLPSVAQNLIEARTVVQFQTDFDADSTKAQGLKQALSDCLVAFNKEATRQAHMNMITNNTRLAYLKYLTKAIRPLSRGF